MRIGLGYDLHPLSPGRKLVIGGVRIPHELGLAGHSDADVLCHAVIDALLGAAGLGDIGGLFPDTDPAYAGADSLELLAETTALVSRHGWRIMNLDATVIAEEPRIAPHAAAIKQNLAAVLHIAPADVGVKGKTNEGLGALGRGEGIAALAVVLLTRVPADESCPGHR
ncbi:MAG: 2-C-methyl-D-erythritol 2,4-cyclodiphosphate synthase [Patescibacteria group bacterium]